MPSTADAKRTARADAKARLRALGPAALAAAGQAIAGQLFARPEWRQAGTVFLLCLPAVGTGHRAGAGPRLAEGRRLCLPADAGAAAGWSWWRCRTLRPAPQCHRHPGACAGRGAGPGGAGAGRPGAGALPGGRRGMACGWAGAAAITTAFWPGLPAGRCWPAQAALVFDTLPADPWDARFAPGDI